MSQSVARSKELNELNETKKVILPKDTSRTFTKSTYRVTISWLNQGSGTEKFFYHSRSGHDFESYTVPGYRSGRDFENYIVLVPVPVTKFS